MKKFLCLALLFLFGLQSTMLAQDDEYISLTFNRSGTDGTATSSVAVSVKDQNDTNITDNATVVCSAGNTHQWKTGGNIGSTILCPNENVGNGNTVTMTFTISDIPEGYTFDKVSLDIHALNGSGGYQWKNTNRKCNVTVEKEVSSDSFTPFASFEDIDIAYHVNGTTGNEDVHQVWESTGAQRLTATSPLVLKLTITRGSTTDGYFFGLSELRLHKAPVEDDGLTFSNLADIKGSKVVRIVTDRADGKVLAEESNKVYLRDYVEGDETQMWEIVSSGSEYQIRNKATGRYIDRGTGTSTSAMPTNASSRNYNIPQAASFTDARPLYNFFHPSTTVNCLYYDGTTDKLQIAALTADAEGYAFGFAIADDYYNAPTPDLNEILAANHGLVRLYSNRATAKVTVNTEDEMKVADGDAAGTTTPSQIWLVEALAGGGYTLRSMSTGKYVQTVDENNTSYPLGDEGATLYIQPSTARTSAFVISTTSTFDNYTCFHHDGSDRVVRWHASDLPSAWSIEPATDADYDELMAQFEPTTPPVEPATDLSTILATNHGLVRLYSNVDETKVAANENNQMKVVVGDAAGTTTSSQIWLIEALDGGGYSLRNMGTGKYVQVAGTTQGTQYSLGNAAATFYITAATKTEKANDFLISSDASCEGMNCLFDNNEGQIVVGHSTEEASAWALVAATDADYDALMEALPPTTPPDESGVVKYYKILNRHYGKALTETWNQNTMKGVDFSGASTQYWAVTERSGKYTIQSVTSKRYIQGDPGQSNAFKLGDNSVDFVFETQTTDGVTHYGIHIDGNSRGLHENSSHNIVSWNYTADASRWILEEVTFTDEQIAAFEAEYHNEYVQYTSEAAVAAFHAFFEDAAATQLKSEYQSMSDADLRSAMSGLATELQDIAVKVKNNSWANNGWEKHFRVAKYGAFSNPTYWANCLNTHAYGAINNPTGIVANNGNKIFIIVGSDIPADVTLKAETRCTPNVPSCQATDIVPQSIVLKKGLNYLPCTNDASHVYITYLSKDGDLIANYPELDIHVEGGSVHGYVDIKKHTDADWASMNDAGLFQADDCLNLLGNYAQLYIKTLAASKNGNSIIPLIEIYDWYVYTELDLMGITAAPESLKDLPGAVAYEDIYPKKVNNRLLCVGIDNGQIHGGNGHICLGTDGGASFYYENIKVPGSNVWGAAHEYGHVNQGAINMIACTERSNNLFANVMLYKSGNCTSRGQNLQTIQQLMTDGSYSWVNVLGKETFLAPHMFYQLYLYYHAAGRDPFFYQKLFKLLREDPLNGANGERMGTEDYLHFALKACEAANEDLTTFFEYWGFFEPVERTHLTEYGRDHYLTTTQAQIDGVKSDMAKYAKKCNAAMMFIEDRAVPSYKENGQQKDKYDVSVDDCATKLPGAQYSAFTGERSHPQSMSYTLQGNYITLNNSEGAAGIKFYDESGKLIYVAAKDYFDIPMVVFNNIDHSKTVVALTDGTTLPLYETTDADKYLITIHHGNGEMTTRYTKGGDGAMLDGARDGKNAIAMIEGENVPESISSATNVAVNNNFYHLSLTDAADFGVNTDATLKAASSRAASTDDLTADQVSYKDRKIWDGWNTGCFPFAVKAEDFGEDAKLEVLDLQSTTADVLYFTEVTEVAAGQPCLIYVPSVIDNWTFSKSGENGAGIPIKGRPEVTEAGFYMNGSFTEKNIGAGHYKMNNSGTAFGITTAAGMISPFRAYISTTQVQGAARLSVEHGGTATGITLPTLTPDNNRLYDLQGCRITTPKKGVPYILNGQKVIFK